MKYRATKTYGHELGLSCCFRQWRAQSHCRFLHGYALAVRLEFGANWLDGNGWVIDFGGLKPIKEWLCETFDHKLLIAEDDPCRDLLEQIGSEDSPDPIGAQLAEVKIVHAVGCEAFAAMIFRHVSLWLEAEKHAPRVNLLSVEVREHGGNGASRHREGY